MILIIFLNVKLIYLMAREIYVKIMNMINKKRVKGSYEEVHNNKSLVV